MKLPICILMLFSMLFFNSTAQAQVPTKTAAANLECEIVLNIYDGFYDWVDGVSYSGSGAPKGSLDKFDFGAVCLANMNDTNGNGTVDSGENEVLATANGRNEVDLMKMVVEQKDPAAVLTGSVTLSKVSGSVKLWDSPEKGSQISITSPITIAASDLPKTYYIEATQASGGLRDIHFLATFDGKEDRVRATAIWVTQGGEWLSGSSPVPQQGVLANVGNIVEIGVSQNEATDGSLYGHGEFKRNTVPWDSAPNKDKKIGGRILMEWNVFPPDAGDVASFDVTRQRKTRTWSLEYGGPDFVPSFKGNMNFPFEADTEPADAWNGEDVEEPNDDAGKFNTAEDREVMGGKLYSFDAPATFQTYNYQGISEDALAFKVSKNSFKEFVRVRSLDSPFTPLDSTLQGSRASEKFDWHCTYYTNKDGDLELAIDNSNTNFAETRILRNGNDIPNIYTVTSQVTNGVNYEVGNFSFVYWGINGDDEKELWVTRIGTDGLIANEVDLFIDQSETTWTFSMDGVNVEIEQITSDNTPTFFLLSTFKTNANAKDNVLNLGGYNNFTR